MSHYYARDHVVLTSNTVRGVNQRFNDAEFQLKSAAHLVRITIQVTTAITMDLAPSSGNKLHLNGGAALTANGLHTFELALDSTRTWDIMSPDGGTVEHLVIQEVSA